MVKLRRLRTRFFKPATISGKSRRPRGEIKSFTVAPGRAQACPDCLVYGMSKQLRFDDMPVLRWLRQNTRCACVAAPAPSARALKKIYISRKHVPDSPVVMGVESIDVSPTRKPRAGVVGDFWPAQMRGRGGRTSLEVSGHRAVFRSTVLLARGRILREGQTRGSRALNEPLGYDS